MLDWIQPTQRSCPRFSIILQALPPSMMAGGELPFEEMKLAQLKEELAARGSTRSGLKAVLQRRLHGLLVEAAIGAHRKRGREFADSADELSSSPGQSDSES